MRVWDINVKYLCQKHLLGEHRELHGLWNILTKHNAKGGYSRHPETIRWIGKQKALYLRHEMLINEFQKRGYNHYTLLDKKFATGSRKQNKFINSVNEQIEILKKKKCNCILNFIKK